MFFSHRIWEVGISAIIHEVIEITFNINVHATSLHKEKSRKNKNINTMVELFTKIKYTSDKKVCADFCAPMCNKYS